MQIQIEKPKRRKKTTKNKKESEKSLHPELTSELQEKLKEKNSAYLDKQKEERANESEFSQEKVGGTVALLGASQIMTSLGSAATVCKAAMAASPIGIAVGVTVIVVGGLIFFLGK
ncbi:MAG: hypothetical protein K6L76_06560 [Agarilytica sp.]